MGICKQLDRIYDEIDDFVLDGKFEEVDKILEKVDVDKEEITILIGYLTITLVPKRHLYARSELYRKIFHRLVYKDKVNPDRLYGLLSGLA